MNGESHTKFNFLSLLEFHMQKKADMSVLLSKSTVGLDYGFVELDENHRLVSFHEKHSLTSTSYINSGIYLLNTFLISPESVITYRWISVLPINNAKEVLSVLKKKI